MLLVQIDPQFEQVVLKSRLLVSAHSRRIVGINREMHFRQIVVLGPGKQMIEDELIDAFAAMLRVDIEKPDIGVIIWVDIMTGPLSLRVA